VLEALPKARTFDAEYYCDNILTGLVSLCPKGGGRKLIIYTCKASARTAQKCSAFCAVNGLGLATHGPYSIDLVPSDFLLFRHVKHGLQGLAFASHERFLTAISEISTDTPKETFHRAFDHWMERLEWVAQNNGDYY
jgi:histone-lysine N-methyltransferase SETMAR